jgi:hypothetical protein
VAVSDNVPVDPIVVLCVESQTVEPASVTSTLSLGAAAPYLRFHRDGIGLSAVGGNRATGPETGWQMDLSYVCQGDLERFIGFDFEDTLDATADSALTMMDGHEVRLTGRYPDPIDAPSIHLVAPWEGRARNLINAALGSDQRADEVQPDSLSEREREELIRQFNACLYRSRSER